MDAALLACFAVVQVLYSVGLFVTVWFFFQRTEYVPDGIQPTDQLPDIILFYPVLHELEDTMRTTFTSIAATDYPRDRLRVISIPNHDDEQTLASLDRLMREFDFLEVMPVPATTDETWHTVWASWDVNDKAYWWHTGKRAGSTALPPKKTRQLIWAMYQLERDNADALLSYIDADSLVPTDYFQTAATGMRHFDVIQNTNITGNLLDHQASSMFALDHICWDATIYPHMTAGGKHPYYVLGKGLFYRFRDLVRVGGFHPWLTIEDPEVGMRLWTNGYRLGVVRSPLVEEVPATFGQGVTQRKRWVAGFFQSLASPLTLMGMPARKRFRARLNFVPTLSLLLNPIGWAIGAWAIYAAVTSPEPVVTGPLLWLGVLNMVTAAALITYALVRAWQASRPVIPRKRDRLWYLVRVNPLFMLLYWLWWTVPLAIGFWMFLRDGGLVWERTQKVDANHELGRGRATRSLGTAPGSAVAADRLAQAGRNAETGGPERSVETVSGPAK